MNSEDTLTFQDVFYLGKAWQFAQLSDEHLPQVKGEEQLLFTLNYIHNFLKDEGIEGTLSEELAKWIRKLRKTYSETQKVRKADAMSLSELLTDWDLAMQSELSRIPVSTVANATKNVFIVHGHDVQPVKELKLVLKELGLNPLVLHEKASGGLTLAEKLEKYSETVGYTFVILTPDDVGCERALVERVLEERRDVFSHYKPLLESLSPRARQNVIFEMGYFWGLLKRKRVCCLLKGDVEKPSDIEGIVYVAFKDSVNERRDMILKELREARLV